MSTEEAHKKFQKIHALVDEIREHDTTIIRKEKNEKSTIPDPERVAIGRQCLPARDRE